MSIRLRLLLLRCAALLLLAAACFFAHHAGAAAPARQLQKPAAAVAATGAEHVLFFRGIISIGPYQLNAAFTPDDSTVHLSISAARCS